MTTDSVLKKYEDSAAYRTMVLEQQAADQASRKALTADRVAEDARHARAMPPILAEFERLKAQRADAEEAVRALDRRLQVAQAARDAEVGAHRNVINRVERQHCELEDPAIADFLAELDRALQITRSKVETKMVRGRKDPHSEIEPALSYTNAAAVATRIEAIQAATRAAVALKSTTLAHEEIMASIAALRATIPALDSGTFALITEPSATFLKPEARQVAAPTEARA